MNPYEGIENDVVRLAATAKRLRRVGLVILIVFGPPSLFLFGGTMIAFALGQPVAQRALIVFPILAVVVFGTSLCYLASVPYVRRGRRRPITVCLCIAISVSILGLLDVWFAMVGEWIYIVRAVVAGTNAVLIAPLLRSLAPAQRLESWMKSVENPDGLHDAPWRLG
jgi:hypothetical protein